ncbi:MAG: hypothetical protein HQK96_07695 [Nitrospirae bacterium]|nr:hypothetical protein [Nitrospirota bacterium]
MVNVEVMGQKGSVMENINKMTRSKSVVESWNSGSHLAESHGSRMFADSFLPVHLNSQLV